jgi:hypothetical protein
VKKTIPQNPNTGAAIVANIIKRTQPVVPPRDTRYDTSTDIPPVSNIPSQSIFPAFIFTTTLPIHYKPLAQDQHTCESNPFRPCRRYIYYTTASTGPHGAPIPLRYFINSHQQLRGPGSSRIRLYTDREFTQITTGTPAIVAYHDVHRAPLTAPSRGFTRPPCTAPYLNLCWALGAGCSLGPLTYSREIFHDRV